MTKAFLFAIVMVLAAAQTLPAQTDSVHVLASGAFKGALEKIRPACEHTVGHKLEIEYDPTAALNQKIEAGAAFDAIVGTSEGLEALSKEGKLAGSHPDIARAGTGIGARAGAPKPDISTPDALKRVLLDAKSVTYAPTGATTAVILKMFDRLGITDQMKAKADLLANGEATTGSVLSGKNQYVITAVSAIVPVNGLELVGPLPSTFQEYITFAVGVSAHPQSPDAAKVMQCFDAPGLSSVYQAEGMEPIPSAR